METQTEKERERELEWVRWKKERLLVRFGLTKLALISYGILTGCDS